MQSSKRKAVSSEPKVERRLVTNPYSLFTIRYSLFIILWRFYMSLRKKATMTEEKLFANRLNGKRSEGPATPEGRERIRDANTRHGFYSPAEAVALACLGEDPAELERLRQSLHGDLQPPSGLQQELVEHLVDVVWRWKRAGRMQEGFALRQAKEVNLTREDRVHAHMMRLKMTEESLRLLAQSVAREYYITTPADLEKMKRLHQEGRAEGNGRNSPRPLLPA